MLKIGIVGGQLQGLEAAYLARQAGFEVALIDRNPDVPAKALADEFCNIDLLNGGMSAESLLNEFDFILPATENYLTLTWLDEMSRKSNVPVGLDLGSYRLSSSKIKSNNAFTSCGIPIPEPWPQCGFPVIVKPSGLSGSSGVIKVDDQANLDRVLRQSGADLVIQKFLPGPSYSLEVLADHGKCVGLQVTKLDFDAGYDCKRVIAGPGTGNEIEEEFLSLGDSIASLLSLSGIMDIEVIVDEGKLKVLEIDARLPSQTPSAVYHSSGVNIVKLLADYWVGGRLPDYRRRPGQPKAVIYEHLKFKNGILEVAGEHILVGAQKLGLYRDKFSADIFISNFEESPDDWVATAIFTENTEEQVWETRNRSIKIIQQAFKAAEYRDPFPLTEQI